MKVVGSGSPRTLTVRLQPCEFGLWREELRRRVSAVSDHQSWARRRLAADELSDSDELVQLSRLLEQAHAPVAAGQPRVLVGPTWLLSHVVRSVAVEAMDRYVDAGRAFCEGSDTPTPEHLRAALDTATACTATVIGLARAEHDPADS